MRTDELLGEYEMFMEKWHIFYKKCIKNPVLGMAPKERLEEFRQALGSVGIFIEETGVELNKLHERMEAEMERGIVECETMFEPDAHTYMPGDEMY